MARFSIGDAVGSGFSLIKRRPLSVFVWGLLTVVPAAAAMGVAIPSMESFMGAAFRSGAMDDPNPLGPDGAMMADWMKLQGALMPMNALRFVLGVIVYTAVIRAVVRPKESSFFSLRLSMDEVRVFVVSLAIIVGLVLGVIVLALAAALVGAGLSDAPVAAKGVFALVLVVGGLIGGLLLGGRLSLLVPATVRLRTFAFAEGWRMGKGKSWSLVGVMLLLVLIVIGIEIVIGGVVGGAMMAVLGNSGFDFASLETGGNPFAGLTDTARANWPWLVVAVLVAAALYGMMTAVLTAPFASVVAQLSATEPADAS